MGGGGFERLCSFFALSGTGLQQKMGTDPVLTVKEGAADPKAPLVEHEGAAQNTDLEDWKSIFLCGGLILLLIVWHYLYNPARQQQLYVAVPTAEITVVSSCPSGLFRTYQGGSYHGGRITPSRVVPRAVSYGPLADDADGDVSDPAGGWAEVEENEKQVADLHRRTPMHCPLLHPYPCPPIPHSDYISPFPLCQFQPLSPWLVLESEKGKEEPPPPPPPGRGVHLDARGQQQGQLPSSVCTRHGAVIQGQSGRSVGTTSRGKGRGCGGRPGRGREGTRGRGADGHRRLRRERGQGKGKGEWREANRCWQLQTAIQRCVMPTPAPPPPPAPQLPPSPGSEKIPQDKIASISFSKRKEHLVPFSAHRPSDLPPPLPPSVSPAFSLSFLRSKRLPVGLKAVNEVREAQIGPDTRTPIHGRRPQHPGKGPKYPIVSLGPHANYEGT